MILAELLVRRDEETHKIGKLVAYPASFSSQLEGQSGVVRILCDASDGGGMVYSAPRADAETYQWKREPVGWKAEVVVPFKTRDGEPAALHIRHRPARAVDNH